MYEYNTLNILGYRSKNVPNTFIKQDKSTNKLAIVFPGFGYTCQKPLLYYTSQVLLSNGFDVLWVEYDYSKNGEYKSINEERQHEWVGIDANAAFSSAAEQRKYKETVLVGKSLGTFAIYSILSTYPSLEGKKIIWFTPLLRNTMLKEFILEKCRKNSLFVAGASDEHTDKKAIKAIERVKAGKVLLIKKANHSLEIDDSKTPQNIKILDEVMNGVSKFIKN